MLMRAQWQKSAGLVNLRTRAELSFPVNSLLFPGRIRFVQYLWGFALPRKNSLVYSLLFSLFRDSVGKTRGFG